LIGLAANVSARPGTADDSLFEERIVPVLRKNCAGCHNERKSRGGLDISDRAKLLQGGKNGPAIVPRRSGESLLVKMISGATPQMPKQRARLTLDEVADIRRWIDQGAPWPGKIRIVRQSTDSASVAWWSLAKLSRPPIPAVRNQTWVQNPIDAFIWAGLESKGMKPAPGADKRTLIRRVTYDLIGVPPTPEEVDAFVRDQSPEAYSRLVERLLASPHYGERWGRHWLDVVHYGDTHGYDKDKRRDHAWPYRDYVIRAFNSDKPHDRFIKEQLAGDMLFPNDPQATIATGFIAAGPWDFVGHVELVEGTVEKEKTRVLDRDDMVGNTITTFLSLTIQCARCHDHKFDPIPKKEYYQLQAVFAGVNRGDRPMSTTKGPNKEVAYGIVSHSPRPIYDLHRGDVQQRRELLQPGVLSCVAGMSVEPGAFDANQESQRRAKLAEWIASRNNPLTWRSIVNRVWHYHFGRGIVDTPNDFGRNGSSPSHPELLDWLASEFRDSGQSIKALHRLIVLSATYQQSSRNNPTWARVDADNRYLWRMNRTRLDAESIRDSILTVSGKLKRTMGGPGFELFRFKDDHSPTYDHSDPDKADGPGTWRRTVYRFTVRSVPNPFLECMDCADPNLNTPVRNTTLTALQALALLNDAFVIKHARFLDERLRSLRPTIDGQIERAYQLILGRSPNAEEIQAIQHYALKHGTVSAWRILFNTNEFVFVD
jgi:hypothetical protein